MAKQPNLSSGPNPPRRVLIVRVGAMGDILHALPAVAALRQLHPDWHIGWAVEPRWLPLLHAESDISWPFQRGPAMPIIDRPYLASTRLWKQRPLAPRTLHDIASLRRELRGGQYDLCVDMQGSIRSAVIGRMAGARAFAGPAEPREAPARWLYRQALGTTSTHVIEQACDLLGAAVGERLKPAKATLPIDEYAETSCDALLSRVNTAGEEFVLIAPTAGWGAKQWLAERYGAVAADLGRAGYRVLVNASSLEDPIAQAVVRASESHAVALPCTLSELIALLRRASLVIAGDTGPLHLAAALEVPVIALFGPTDPARNGPYDTPSRILRHPSSRQDHTRHSTPEQGLLQITPEEVAAAALELLHAEEGPKRVR